MVAEKVATGRRKTAVASVRLREGTGQINVNNRTFTDYFTHKIQQNTILKLLDHVGGLEKFDLIIRVKGGGPEGQTIAVRHGLARALVAWDENLRGELKAQGYLTRDSRKRERKKYGLAGARKRFQFSKR